MQHQTKIALLRALILWGGIGYGSYYVLNTETISNLEWVKSTKSSISNSIHSYFQDKKNQLREHTIDVVNQTFSYKEEKPTPPSHSVVEIKNSTSLPPNTTPSKVKANLNTENQAKVDVTVQEEDTSTETSTQVTPIQGMIPPPIHYGNIPLPSIPEPIKMKRP